MTEIEKGYFLNLNKDRTDSAKVLKKASMKNVWTSVVEKYSDQAHFLYELIQNADDAGANYANFILEKDKLIFIHDGNRRFSISNPETEEIDAENGMLGDINAIASIANSSKNKDKFKIGKFGVGFKAVFQYTNTPYIYDDNCCFKIVDYLVPVLLEEDHPLREKGQTLFVIPFNHKDKTQEETYEDISRKLKSLVYPTLFLSKLYRIAYKIGTDEGEYTKECASDYSRDDTAIEYMVLNKSTWKTNDEIKQIERDNLWMFSRLHDGLKYSVGFYDTWNKLIAKTKPAFCFFPTKVNTGLNFIIHAPFILTDSREGIRAGLKHNIEMISRLADLAADALVYLRDIGDKIGVRLIDDDIFKLIPIDETVFTDIDDRDQISFRPFYDSIRNIFEQESLLPTRDGYAATEQACWASVLTIPKLFSDEQISMILQRPEKKFVCVSISRDEARRNNRTLYEYINSLCWLDISEERLLKDRWGNVGIDAEFIEAQPIEWLHTFYKWMSETSNRSSMARSMEIFLNDRNEASSLYDAKEQPILFLPNELMSGFNSIHPELLKNEETYKFLLSLGISEPSQRDYLYNVVLSKYGEYDSAEDDKDFELLFKYYCQCPYEEIDGYIANVKDCRFLRCYKDDDQETVLYNKGSNIYYPNEILKDYFSNIRDTVFLDIEYYQSKVTKENRNHLNSFFRDLGVASDVRPLKEEVEFAEARSRNYPRPHYSQFIYYYDKGFDGCLDKLNLLGFSLSLKSSLSIWNLLARNVKQGETLKKCISGVCKYFYYQTNYEPYTPYLEYRLKHDEWLMTKDGAFVAPCKCCVNELSDEYDAEDVELEELVNYLGIKEPVVEEETLNPIDDLNLTDSQKENLMMGEKAMALGLTYEDLERMAQLKAEQESKQFSYDDIQFDQESETNLSLDDFNLLSNDVSDSDLSLDDFDLLANDSSVSNLPSDEVVPLEKKKEKVRKRSLQVLNKVKAEALYQPILDNEEYAESKNQSSHILDEMDSDDYIPASVSFEEKVKNKQAEAARGIRELEYQDRLQSLARRAKKYSYGWFKALLELEKVNSSDNYSGKAISLSFGKVKREPESSRILILEQPSKYIPAAIEELSDIPLVLHFGAETRQLIVEVANIRSYTLRVKIKPIADIDEIDFAKVTEARIDAKSPVFLLDELSKSFNSLGYDNGFDMKANLPKNLRFVFGPPGTGKTTYLAKETIIPFIESGVENILVLAPTNKAADVLVKRIMSIMGDDESYHDWLLRFGGTCDEDIEKSGVYQDKTVDIRKRKQNVVVTTIARYPYDYFLMNHERIQLSDMDWNYIIIDEASMIPLVNIIYPIYRQQPKEFIIAGDPLQIEPITAVADWKDENIYKMVKLNSFIKPHTEPYDYPVKLLDTQYRSIPAVGDVFSKLSYGGVLNHYRSNKEQKILSIGNYLDLAPLNVIRYPVSKYESIYKPQRLSHSSSYQVYSALFTYEFVSYLSSLLAEANREEKFSIGVIAPYKAEADMIEKLVDSMEVPTGIKVQVGTIHGFQGDECDIIIAVFNTPPSITASREAFLNKLNIINVAISRARDYLIVVYPDDNTPGLENLSIISRLENLIKNSGNFKSYSSSELENKMFGDEAYLEKNAFSTGHQSVNVYGAPEKKYEIRSEDYAVDIQVRKYLTRSDSSESGEQDEYSKDIDTPMMSDKTVEFIWLDSTSSLCLKDNGKLVREVIPVYKKNGTLKHLQMYVCTQCGRRYIVKNTLSNTVNLNEYDVLAKEEQTALLYPVNEKPASFKRNVKSSDIVFNKEFGKGRIVARFRNENGREMITVEYRNNQLTYDSKLAFEYGTLKRL